MQTYDSLDAFRDAPRVALDGPVALLLCEDATEVASSFGHMVARGFRTVVVMGAVVPPLPPGAEGVRTVRIGWRNDRPDAVAAAVNTLIDKGPGLWMHMAFNAEYLFFPFCETRRVDEMLAFHAEERRAAMMTYVVDLYAADLGATGAVCLKTAHLDASGYYANARPDPDRPDTALDRQLDFFGGLRWRYEEHVPAARRRIDRIGLFRAVPALRMRPDFTFSETEYNTYACPWHNNLTAAVCSFRAAKALATNAGSRAGIDSFMWDRSVPFDWRSGQLLDLGLMEPGQWF